ncbi:MAG: FkbM family methyltransferase [Phenylobacterium sp.]|uniref:FkbM family methyltransferase n=2 Tax=Phenylobacterium sp. TaxID=1871053 RepID=UPI0017C80BDB|nr:FkbM family methyltransferase [Phenylobacterium sp.]MBA4792216.1 FkbM family methyltransferase [Phenylobacterium sp.]
MSEHGFRTEVAAAIQAPPANRPLARDLLSGALDRPCFVVGRNEDTAALVGRLRLDGVVHDYAEPGAMWNGLPCVPIAALPPGAVVINGSTSISPIAVDQRLRAAGLTAIVSLHDLVCAGEGAVAAPAFVREQQADWRDASAEWSDLFASLEDDASRQTLLDVLRYRLTADVRFMGDYRVRIEEQYFEPFLELKGETFVDAGGFDGDTTEGFCQRDPDYRQVHLFEPSPRNLRAARERLQAFRDIAFHPEALSDAPGTMRFDAEAGSASAVSSGGGQEVPVTTLDLAVAEPVSFIKMDLEGWEMKALAGGARHIGQDRPKLAIAVYHSASDFRDVWRYARSIHPDYKVYLRHYTQGWSETVMFFV